jgi:trimethylamine--corrinoid protein Co-methyltransferase
VVDNEIIGMVMRAVEGIEVNDKTLALDEIKKVGPGGHFVSSRHTRKYMRTEHYQPQLSDRETRDKWLDAGAQDTRERTSSYVHTVLDREPENVLPAEVRDWIKKEIPALRSFIME